MQRIPVFNPIDNFDNSHIFIEIWLSKHNIMPLIKSISGIRGTIGDSSGDGLTPADIVKFVTGYGAWLSNRFNNKKLRVVVGRDARMSGKMVNQLVTGTLMGCGIDILDLGLATTPTVEIAVTEEVADGGIIITASHNPSNWNALKLLNEKGEFVSDADGKEILSLAEADTFRFAESLEIGEIIFDDSYSDKHIQKILELELVDRESILNSRFKIVVDGINSVGGVVVPQLLKALGVDDIIELNCNPDGNFSHNPEPIPENLKEISELVRKERADLGIVVDPDVDRLALVNEDGSMFGEEYTLVAVADYVLKKKPGNTVSNLSSTRALSDISASYGHKHFASAVGEVNVVEMMKQKDAIIGGEGNGGVILPDLHYGRDALVGIALFLTHLSKSGLSCSELRKSYPDYYISKNKLTYSQNQDIDQVIAKIKDRYKSFPINDIDGLKIDFENEWIHLRKSNTEPIIRIYAESTTLEKASALAHKIIQEISPLLLRQ